MRIFICIFASSNILKNDMQDIAIKIKLRLEYKYMEENSTLLELLENCSIYNKTRNIMLFDNIEDDDYDTETLYDYVKVQFPKSGYKEYIKKFERDEYSKDSLLDIITNKDNENHELIYMIVCAAYCYHRCIELDDGDYIYDENFDEYVIKFKEYDIEEMVEQDIDVDIDD